MDDDLDLLKTLITGDESFLYGYNIETKTQLSQLKRAEESRPKKHDKLVLTKFCSPFMVHHEFLPQGRTEYYLEAVHWMREETHRIVEKPIMDFAQW